MRVIAGKFKRSILYSVDDMSVRPVMDRVKEYIFNVLSDRVQDADVCDIFAGSGALGIEAISRGAKHVSFVDLQLKSIKAIDANVEKFSIKSQCHILKQDAFRFVERHQKQYDIIFCDPPYRFKEFHEIIENILKANMLKDDGILITEHHSKIQFDKLVDGYHIIRDKKFGKTIITMIGKSDGE